MATTGASPSVEQLQNLIRKTPKEGAKPKPVIKSGPLQFLNQCCCANASDEVFPGIIVGDHTYAQDVSKLRSVGVTHVLNACQGGKFAQVPSKAEDFQGRGYSLRFLGLQAQDVSGYKLSQHFQEATDFIHDARTSGGKAFVHCYQGISRSATLVLAYLMMHENMSLEDAIVTVRKRREVFPNSGFLRQLIELDEQLQKERSEQSQADIESS